MLEKIRAGSTLETNTAKSPAPLSATSSMRSRAWPRIHPSRVRMFFGLNASIVIPRNCVCRGASIAMNDCTNSVSSGAKLSMMTPSAEENTSGFRLARRMSSCLVSDQNPFVLSSGGSRSDSTGRLHGTGFSRRSTVNAASRSAVDLAQKLRALRSMSPWVVVVGMVAVMAFLSRTRRTDGRPNDSADDLERPGRTHRDRSLQGSAQILGGVGVQHDHLVGCLVDVEDRRRGEQALAVAGTAVQVHFDSQTTCRNIGHTSARLRRQCCDR